MSGPLAFVDVETTGLDPDRHEVYEVALITDDNGQRTEYRWWIEDVELRTADPDALRISRYYQRYPTAGTERYQEGVVLSATSVAALVAKVTAGRHLVGAVPSLDAAFLTRLLRRAGYAPAWHYHLVDVEALVAGWLAAAAGEFPDIRSDLDPTPPWNSRELALALRVEHDPDAQHTALGDARWAAAIYDAVMMGHHNPKPADG
jgi:DNA polymerase III epsilon subunit-like protein